MRQPAAPMRSRRYLLHVMADRLAASFDPADKPLAQALRKQAATITKNWSDADQERVDRQRTLFNMLPSTNATDHLREAMLQRAYDVLWEGDAEACDALIEFLPSDAVGKMLDAWEADQAGGKPLSRWYEGRP